MLAMKALLALGLGVALFAGLTLIGCDDQGPEQQDLEKIRAELAAVRKELVEVKNTQRDMVPHLENMMDILKLTRREVGNNGDVIAGLRDHITLTVRSFAANGKGDANGAAEDPATLVERLKGLGVVVDAEAKTLTIDGVVATPAGALEFAAVAEGGKAHESLFMLNAEPRGLNAGLLALGLTPGKAGRFVGGKPMSPTGPKVYLYATWSVEGKEVTWRVEDLIIDLKTQKPLVRRGFTYHGSRYQKNSVTGKRFYAADVTRDLVAVWNSQNTILDLDTPEAAWDDTYVAHHERMPPKGTPVKLVIRVKPKDE